MRSHNQRRSAELLAWEESCSICTSKAWQAEEVAHVIMTPSWRTRNEPAGPRKGLLRKLLPGLCACPRLPARAAAQRPCMATVL